MDAIDDDSLHVIAFYLADQVFTFDAAHTGSLARPEDGLLTVDDRYLLTLARRQRMDWLQGRDATIVDAATRVIYDYKWTRLITCLKRWATLRQTLRTAFRGLLSLAACSTALHRRLRWVSVYREVMPLQVAGFFRHHGVAVGIPSYELIADDQYLDTDYYYLSLVRGFGPDKWYKGDRLDAMTRQLQKYTQRARRREREGAPPRRSKRLCIEGRQPPHEEEEEEGE